MGGLAKDRVRRRGLRAESWLLLRADSHRVWRAVFAEKAPLPMLEMALLSSLISSMRAHAAKRASETDSRRLSLSMTRLASRDEGKKNVSCSCAPQFHDKLVLHTSRGTMWAGHHWLDKM